MAVLTASKQRPVRLPPGGLETRSLPLAGYTNFGASAAEHTVYKGSVVVCDQSDTDGYYRAAPLTSSTAANAADIIGGVALEKIEVKSSDTADGSKNVTVAVNGTWGFPVNSIAITDIGADIYTSDDGEVVTTTSTNNFWIGKLVGYDTTYAWVDIAPATGHVNAPPAA